MTTRNTCPDWCTSAGRWHDDDNSHDGPGTVVHGVELGTGTVEGAPVVTLDATSAILTIDQAGELAAALGSAIAWARRLDSKQPPAAGGLHLDGCTLNPEHRGACILDRPFRIRPEGGREYLGGDR